MISGNRSDILMNILIYILHFISSVVMSFVEIRAIQSIMCPELRSIQQLKNHQIYISSSNDSNDRLIYDLIIIPNHKLYLIIQKHP